MNDKPIFKDYREYYSLTRTLDPVQKDLLFKSLPKRERESLFKSYSRDGWEDLVIVNEVDKYLDETKEKYGIDLVYLRIRVLSGDIEKVKRSWWLSVQERLSCYAMRYVWHILGGVKTIDLDDDFVILASSRR